MLLTLMSLVGMFGPTPPTPSGSGSAPIDGNDLGGGWHEKSKKDRIKKQNQESVIVSISEWIIRNNN